MRRLTVLSLPPLLVFPDYNHTHMHTLPNQFYTGPVMVHHILLLWISLGSLRSMHVRLYSS